MGIGIYNGNTYPRVDSFTIAAKERKIKLTQFSRINELPNTREVVLPEVFVVNPLPCLEEDYWAKIRGCVQSHPDTRFFVLAFGGIEDYAQKFLGEQKNVEYLTIRNDGIKKLMGLLD
jgi:hypothetical protein